MPIQLCRWFTVVRGVAVPSMVPYTVSYSNYGRYMIVDIELSFLISMTVILTMTVKIMMVMIVIVIRRIYDVHLMQPTISAYRCDYFYVIIEIRGRTLSVTHIYPQGASTICHP